MIGGSIIIGVLQPSILLWGIGIASLMLGRVCGGIFLIAAGGVLVLFSLICLEDYSRVANKEKGGMV